jgi:hypothetical protein
MYDLVQQLRYALEVLVLLSALAVILRVNLKRRFAWSVAVAGIAMFVVDVCAEVYHGGSDLSIFWGAGRAVWSGRSPYDDARFLNPPTALPFYTALAILPFRTCIWLWAALNIMCTLGLVPLSHRCLIADPDYHNPRLESGALAILTAAFSLSYGSRYGVTVKSLRSMLSLS